MSFPLRWPLEHGKGDRIGKFGLCEGSLALNPKKRCIYDQLNNIACKHLDILKKKLFS
jgi:hypothetical protein